MEPWNKYQSADWFLCRESPFTFLLGLRYAAELPSMTAAPACFLAKEDGSSAGALAGSSGGPLVARRSERNPLRKGQKTRGTQGGLRHPPVCSVFRRFCSDFLEPKNRCGATVLQSAGVGTGFEKIEPCSDAFWGSVPTLLGMKKPLNPDGWSGFFI